MTYSRVYSSRLSGPKVINDGSDGGVQFTVPAGHRYVVRFLHVTQTGGSGFLVARLVLGPVSGTPQPMMSVPVGVDTTVFPECFLVFGPGERLIAYRTPGPANLVLTTGGHDLLDID